MKIIMNNKKFQYYNKHRKIYFAYGSNLNRTQMKQRCPNAQFLSVGFLKDYRLAFRGVADVEKAKGEKAWGAFWRVTPKCIVALDAYEGYPYLYTKHNMKTKHGKGFFYIMVNQRDIKNPSNFYYDAIKQGYRQCNLPSLKPLTKALKESKMERNTDVVDCGAKWGINTRKNIVAVPSQEIEDIDPNEFDFAEDTGEQEQPNLFSDLHPYGRY